MKFTFTFTDSPDLSSLSRDNLYHSYFELPDTALQIPTAKEQVLAIAGLAGQLTRATLHITCKEFDLKNHPIKLTVEKRYENERLEHVWWNTIICFQSFTNRDKFTYLKIRLPIASPVPDPPRYASRRSKGDEQLRYNLFSPQAQGKTDEQIKYLATIQAIAEHCVSLLNSEPLSPGATPWRYTGFHPFWEDKAARTLFSKRIKKRRAETRKREKQAKKQQERESKTAQSITDGQESVSMLKTGAGRRVGAVPGIFKGVQFRSQLEIRFVTQLEAKQIRWVYEGERLGDGNYLVDFYLPDLRCWVEVKGRLEPRDDYLLKDVAAVLKRERNERLFVYTQSKAFSVTAKQFKQLTHDEFWVKLV